MNHNSVVTNGDGETSIRYQKRINGKIDKVFAIPSEKAALIDDALAQVAQELPPHGNSRPVVICGEVLLSKYQSESRPTARPITHKYFHSTTAASHHFGYFWDAVGQALQRAEKRGKEIAMVAGVPVRRVDSIK